jgi:hypothetical protein
MTVIRPLEAVRAIFVLTVRAFHHHSSLLLGQVFSLNAIISFSNEAHWGEQE